MSETRPTGEQLRFVSAATGEHILDTYLEAAEKGGRTLADMLADIYDPTTGLFRSDYFEFRITSDRQFQVRVGDFPDNSTGWQSVQSNPSLFAAKGAWAATTAYVQTDIVTYTNSTYYCLVPHTSTSTFDATKWAVMSDGTALNTATSTASTSATAAAASAATAATSATTATTKAAEAVTSATAAAASATTAGTQAATATTKATEANTSANSAATSASNAAASASTASTAATTSTTKAAEANSSASSASNSATTATTQATLATSKAADATNKAAAASADAATALTRMVGAETAANAASASAAAALASEQGANTSSGNATTKAAQAATSQTAAAASATSASTSASTATTKASEAAASASSASTSATTATTGATTATTKAAEAASSASAAATSATAASASQTASANSATASANSATSSATSASSVSGAAATATAKASEAAASAAAINATFGNAASVAALAQTAQAQASLAQGYAASASSVVQQDLSGITAQALHRSPNAITAQFIYDTSKDSDGGAWTERCQGTSWYNEALAGKWLGAHSLERVARLAGASVGPELVINGTFASGDLTGWTSSNTGTGTISVENGMLKIVRNGSGNEGSATQTLSVVSGKSYVIEFTYSGAGEGYFASTNSTPGGRPESANFSPGFYRWVFVANSSTVLLRFSVAGSTIGTGFFDNISVREVTALNTASNDYFQLTTDGKFYRLWKNLFSRSAEFDAAAWSSVAGVVNVSTNVTAAPDGTLTADKLIPAAATSWQIKRQGVTVAAGVYTFSVYAKEGEPGVRLELFASGTGGSRGAVFNLNTGAVVVASASVQTSVGDLDVYGFRRYSITITATSGAAGFDIRVTEASNVDAQMTGNGVKGIFVWGAQLELGTTATTYEPKSAEGTTTEIFRGNKADFPRLAAIVADSIGVTIYDLTEPGRPMWMRFIGGNGQLAISWANNTPGVSTLASANGLVVIGSIQSNNVLANFASDDMRLMYGGNSTYALNARRIADRHATGSYVFAGSVIPPGFDSYRIASNIVNAIAMTVLPDAPIDPATGLRVPTIAVATGGGVSVIKHNGTVVNSSDTTATKGKISFDRLNRVLWSTIYYTVYCSPVPPLSGGFSSSSPTSISLGGTSFSTNNVPIKPGIPSDGAFLATNVIGSAYGVTTYRAGQSASRVITSAITNTYNTGWLTGDIRRAYLSDVDVGSIGPGGNIVTNGDFVTDVTGWTPMSGGSIAWSSGAAVVTGGGANTTGVYQPITCVVGKTYRFQATVTFGTATIVDVYVAANATGGGGAMSGAYGYLTSSQTFVGYFTATATTHSVGLLPRGAGLTATFDNVSVTEAVLDRSYKSATAPVFGTLTKSQLASGTSLVGYSGFSAANYLREPYSADLDFGTGEWSCSAWLNTTFAAAGNLTLNSNTFSSWNGGNGFTRQADLITAPDGNQYANKFLCTNTATAEDAGVMSRAGANPAGTSVSFFVQDIGVGKRIYFYDNSSPNSFTSYFSFSTKTFTNSGQAIVTSYDELPNNWYRLKYYLPQGNANYLKLKYEGVAVGDALHLFGHQVERTSAPTIYKPSGASQLILTAPIADRSFSSGPSLMLGVNSEGKLAATAFDGTTTRSATTTAAYNTATWLKADANYTTDGSLTIRVNGREVAATRGNPLLTLTNTSAVLTIGNSYAADAPFPGTIALLKLGATVPTPEQATFMYEQEKQLFRANAQSVLPDTGSVVDMAYDDATDRWVAVSAANESYWTGLIRNTVTPVPAGSYTKIVATSGIELAARSTTNPGVDVTIPAYGLREELVKRAEAAARLGKELSTFDYVGGFTANTTSGNTAITSASTITYPGSYIGARISGSGIPTNTTIVAVSGTTLYLSAAATATATTVQITFIDFALPAGMEAKTVFNAGVQAREGVSAAFTRLYDGFIETIRFGAAPGYTALVTIQAQRISQ